MTRSQTEGQDGAATRRDLLIALLLVVATLAAYAPAVGNRFVFDDEAYVTDNPMVQRGLSRESVAWAFTSGEAANWHPLTWLTHMLDVEIYGLDPAGHHLTNLILHLANALLLFLVLRRMTRGSAWTSGLVAGLFALHPAHVESVAWVSERKDVLSTLFWLLTTWAYVGYTDRPNALRYALTLVLFTLGLLAKQMLVTLPFVLLLLDGWPLRRLEPPAWAVKRWGLRSPPDARARLPLSTLVREKIPFFVASLAASVATVIAQGRGGAIAGLETASIGMRLGNALVSYVAYLGTLVWPVDLSVFYPYRTELPLWQPAAALLVLSILTVWAVNALRHRPYITTGWLWYLGTLVPVIGLVQIGEQMMADRYTYIPSIGLFVAAAWLLADLGRRTRGASWLIAAAASVALAASAAATFRQVERWRDGRTLFEHALRVTEDNYLAHDNLAWALSSQGRIEEALAHYQEALRIKPDYAISHNNVGRIAIDLGRVDDALLHLGRAVELAPGVSAYHLNLAIAQAAAGQLDKAESSFEESIRLAPGSAHAEAGLGQVLANLGASLVRQARYPAAALLLESAIEIAPELPDAHVSLAHAELALGRLPDAFDHYQRAVELEPDPAGEYYGYGTTLATQANFGYGHTLAALGKPVAAAEQYREALRLSPGWPPATVALAWLLVTTENDSLQNADEAMTLAIAANRQTAGLDPKALDALAAAHAAKGQFSTAVAVAALGAEVARSNRRQNLARGIAERLAGYRQGRPFRQAAIDLSE